MSISSRKNCISKILALEPPKPWEREQAMGQLNSLSTKELGGLSDDLELIWEKTGTLGTGVTEAYGSRREFMKVVKEVSERAARCEGSHKAA